MEEKIISLCEMLLNFIKNLPLTDLLVGVVVPIVAAWISYYLAERAIRKKENNRLYVQIELLRRELQKNDSELIKFVDSVDEKNRLDKKLEFPLLFMKNFLVTILDELQEIKQKYMHSGPFIFEKPTRVYILAQKLEDLEKEITELKYKYCDDEYLEEKRKEKLSKLTEEKEEYFEDIKGLKDKDIYKEFFGLQLRMEKLMVGDIFKKEDKEDGKENNFILAKYIYERIKMFNETGKKTKDDVLSLYKDLVIFEIDADIIKDDCFDQESFDLYYKAFERPEGIQKKLYDLCEHYYKRIALKKKIENYCFVFESKKWNENSSDFVIINDRALYIELVEFYAELNKFVEQEDNCEERYNDCIALHNRIQSVVNKLNSHEVKLKKKCK